MVQQLATILTYIVNLTNAKYPEAEVFLYGSRARGDAKKTSDWDLLVLLNQSKIPFGLETELMDDFYELELKTGEVFSPLIYSKSDWYNNYALTPLYENIQKEGIKIK
jgi:predicted nucleotidyltransferase